MAITDYFKAGSPPPDNWTNFQNELTAAAAIGERLWSLVSNETIHQVLREALADLLMAENNQALTLYTQRLKALVELVAGVEFASLSQSIDALAASRARYLTDESLLRHLRWESVWIAFDIILIVMGSVLPLFAQSVRLVVVVLGALDLSLGARGFFEDVSAYFSPYFADHFNQNKINSASATQYDAKLINHMIAYSNQQASDKKWAYGLGIGVHAVGFSLALVVFVGFFVPFLGLPGLVGTLVVIGALVAATHTGLYVKKCHEVMQQDKVIADEVNSKMRTDKSLVSSQLASSQSQGHKDAFSSSPRVDGLNFLKLTHHHLHGPILGKGDVDDATKPSTRRGGSHSSN